MFVIGRVLIGFGNGIQITAYPVLVAELAYPTQRTHITGFMNTTGSLGSLMAAWITFATGTAAISLTTWSWRLPSLLQAVSSLLQLTLSFFVPESPRWLVYNNRREEAYRLLVKYYAEGNESSPLLQFEMAEIDNALEAEKAQSLGTWMEWFRTRGNRYRIFIVLTSGFIIQCGITDAKTQLLINGGTNISGVCFGIFWSFFIERMGRRPLCLIGMAGMFVAFLLLTILTSVNQSIGYSNHAISGATVAMIFIFGAFYKIAWPHVSPYNLRAKAFVVNGFGDAAANVFSSFVNPIALAALGWKYYIVWCCVLVSNFTLIYLFFPKTKRLSLEEVAEKFDGTKLDLKMMDEENAFANAPPREVYILEKSKVMD
ncbi:hypothetical protein BZG36_04982 [Bifiguratus adelaidae]|uniref:Major facilitator superfamily (MFS) profile domain-containing protein n=1 Tax=Bifiguratus adelaidae TaxID=1938954 RepID=A0A261XV67_9FUNG|nr:hypothetical protein BZG36_04982 [Bifiguratus adelaidae]